MSINLYPHQAHDYNILTKKIQNNRRIIFMAATGYGKGVVIPWAAKHLNLGKTLVLCHREVLVDQLIGNMALLGMTSEKIVQKTRKLHHKSDCYVGMIETVYNRVTKNPNYLKDVGLIICDESHRLEFIKLFEYFPNAKIVGFTATPVLSYRDTYFKCNYCKKEYPTLTECCHQEVAEYSRPRTMSKYYDDIVVGASIEYLIEHGFLVQDVSICKTFDDTSLKQKNGEFTTESLDEVFDTDEAKYDVIKHYEEYAKGKKTIIFNSSINANQHLLEEFKKAGYENVQSDDSRNPNPEIISWFKKTPDAILLNVDKYTAGMDVTDIECVILNRATLSLSLYLQMCLDLDTEILTKDGWKKYNEVNKGDVVASFDLKTKEISYAPCLNKVYRDMSTDESFYSLKSPYVDLRVTDRHNLISRARSGKGYNVYYKLREAQEVSALKSGYEIPISGYTNNEDDPNLSDDDLRFIGWVLSDGSINKKTKAITISQSLSQPKYLHESIVSSIKGCGFKYGVSTVKRTGELSKYSDINYYYVAYGKPRKTDTHLSGWSRLEKYLDKNISDDLMKISRRQLSILLETINHGDGSKHKTAYWQPRSMSIAMGINKIYAERLQIMCITNGYKCNLSTLKNNNGNDIIMAYIKDRDYANIKGFNEKDGNRLLNTGYSKEKVWCVETEKGTIITRRNGKVTIMGNCGRGGRSTKLIPKDHFILIDLGGNVKRHLEWSDPSRDWERIFFKGVGEDKPKKQALEQITDCENCGMLMPRTQKKCTECGYEEPEKQRYESAEEEVSDIILQPLRKTPPPNGEAIYKYVKHIEKDINYALNTVLVDRIVDMFITHRVNAGTIEKTIENGKFEERVKANIQRAYFVLTKKADIIPENWQGRTINTLVERVKNKLKKRYGIQEAQQENN